MSVVSGSPSAQTQSARLARAPQNSSPTGQTFWRVEGSLINLGAVRPVAYFTWNAQSFSERWKRRAGVTLAALLRPLFYAEDRILATRVLHTLLRGISRDRLDLLGEEFFHYVLKPKLKPEGVAQLKAALARGEKIVLVSQGLDHVMRPLAAYLGVEQLIANRLEFRDGLATGRLLSIKQSFAGKNILLIGFTGFIGKVWLAKLLKEVPDVGRVFLLIRRQRSVTAQRRFDKVAEESPLFDCLHEQHGTGAAQFMADKVEVIEGDIAQENLGLDAVTLARLRSELDLIVNSAGLTDFNPDLRQALAINVDGTTRVLDFQRGCQRATLLHLSTCYVVGFHDGRITERLQPDYTPKGLADFNAEREYKSLHALADEIEARAESEAMTVELRRQVLAKPSNQGKQLSESEMAAQLRKQRQRWVKNELIVAGIERARSYGWPNTYTFTKSLAESLMIRRASDLPIAIVRPSIVETSTHDPFEGWNEGVNTSAPISYLLGTFFRQMPTNGNKCLDIIPVDLVCRGMLLIGAALIARRHAPLYQLATSATNPCNMRRTIELTGLAHRKHYRAQDEFNQRLLAYFDTIPVSEGRYRNLSAPRQKQLVQALQRILAPLPMARSPLVRRERDLDRVEKIIELYEPFILHNEYIFEARNVELLSALLPEEERAAFGYDASYIDWWDYWINVHIPALRKWSYPIIEGRPVENKTTRAARLPAPEQHPTSA